MPANSSWHIEFTDRKKKTTFVHFFIASHILQRLFVDGQRSLSARRYRFRWRENGPQMPTFRLMTTLLPCWPAPSLYWLDQEKREKIVMGGFGKKMSILSARLQTGPASISPRPPPTRPFSLPAWAAGEAASLQPRTQGCQQRVRVASFIRPHR